MAIASNASLVDALRQYRLLEPVQLEEAARLHSSHPEPKALAGELIQRKWLTPYQANQLLQGRGADLLLGSYVLLEKLGEGGMGAVFKARNWKLGRVVALKLIRKERLESPDAVRRFQREIQAAAALTHANIVRAYDADEIDGAHLLVMEHVEGTDLAKRVKQQGPLPVERACEYVRQAALGLQHAYERGMVHRDIKPANLLLSADGKTVKILDMGLARLDRPSADGEASSTMTQEGAIMGTPDYIAPEQAMESHTVDIRADLYSLGCTFYYLLTGQVPFPGGSLTEKLIKHQLQEPVPVERLRPDAPLGVARVVRKLMAKKPEDRYQTPGEAATALASPFSAGAGEERTVAEGRPAVADPPTSGDTFSSPFASLEGGPAEAGNALRRRWTAAEQRWLLYLVAGGSFVLLSLVVLVSLFWKELAGTTPSAEDRVIGAKTVPPVPPVPIPVATRHALAFGGIKTRSRVVIPSWSYQGDHPLTVEAWAVLEGPADGLVVEQLMGDPEAAGFSLSGSKKWSFHLWLRQQGAYVGAKEQQPLPRNQLIHVAGVYAPNSEVRFYVNGQLQERTPAKGAYKPSPVPFTLGANPNLNDTFIEHFLGRMQGVRISRVARYDKDFTPARSFEPDKDTVALYHFDEGQGDVLKDSSGNGHHGKIVGARWVKAVESPPTLPPLYPGWLKRVAAMPALEQVKAVADMLKDRNLGFDGKVTHKIEGGVVTGLGFLTDNVTDLSPAQALIGLRWLGCMGSSPGKGTVANLSPLKNLNLTSLHCQNTNVSDLSPLKNMNLTLLYCYGTKVSDLSPLKNMNLTDLSFHDTWVSDLSPLKAINLTYLNCGNTQVTDLSPLKGMPLTRLDCYGAKVSDLSPLKGMPLKQLDCMYTQVSDLSPLKDMKLTLLWCAGTQTSDLSPLKGMKLTDLSCHGTKVSDLSPLKNMNLTSMHCARTKVSDLTPLREMQLKILYCDFKPERDGEILRSLKTLEKINGKPARQFWQEVDAKKLKPKP